MSTKLEINFNRLLNRCETIASDKQTWDWRLEKYIAALQEQLGEMKRSTSKPSQDVLIEYSRRVDFLKGLFEAEQQPTLNDKAIAAERLAPVTHTHKPTGVAPKEVHATTKSRLQSDMRSQLLGETDNKQSESAATGVRQRKPQEDGGIDAVLQHHRKIHEKLADELLHHTYNLKDVAYASRAIVKKDIEKVSDTTRLAETNYTNLQRESNRLEAKTQSCSWWIWIMLVLVTLTFLWMIILMRMLPKS